ncbi:MAG: exosortase A, partial [Candidatus Binatia bacterium]
AKDWWEDPNYSHGFLIPVVALLLAWRARDELRAAPRDGSWSGLPVLLGGVGMLLIGVMAAEEFLMRGSLVIVIAGLVLLHGGRRVFQALAFPIAFLAFMVPLPFIVFNAVAFPLQALAAANAAWALDSIGVPVFREGNVIHLSQISLGVTEACSGIRSLVSLLALAVVWAHLALGRTWRMLLFVAAAVPITIVANACRVILTGLIGQSFGVEYARGFFHSFSGWVIFVVAAVCLLVVQAVMSRVPGPALERHR